MARITMREAISQALWEEMERDPDVFIMGEEVGLWGGTYAVTKGFFDHFGEKRVRDTPIAEAVIVGSAIGAALTELRNDSAAREAMARAGRAWVSRRSYAAQAERIAAIYERVWGAGIDELRDGTKSNG